MNRLFVQIILFAPLLAGGAFAQEAGATYKTLRALGWTMHINSEFYNDDTSLLRKSFKLFGEEMTAINEMLPKYSLPFLKDVPFWLVKEVSLPGATAAYCSSTNWGNKKSGYIEVGVSAYYKYKTQDNEWVIMHELAHAFHHKVLGFDNPDIIRVYKIIKAAGLYRNVRHRLQTYAHGYALKNHQEYFAEISTCYFGWNNYYPNDRTDLRQYDPLGYALVESMWHVKDGIEVDPPEAEPSGAPAEAK